MGCHEYSASMLAFASILLPDAQGPVDCDLVAIGW